MKKDKSLFIFYSDGTKRKVKDLRSGRTAAIKQHHKRK